MTTNFVTIDWDNFDTRGTSQIPAQCPYCNLGTDGQHEWNCPLHPNNRPLHYHQGVYGWICPKCGGVYGPNTSECPRCSPPPVVTCSGMGAAT